MIVKPVLIIGAPRSGTSLLQKILRNHPVFWSLPSESDMIWDQFCHPRLRGWDSECLDESDITTEDRDAILKMFEDYMRPASFWRPFEKTNVIWGFRRAPLVRQLLRAAFKHMLPLLKVPSSANNEKRLLEKTASNCFRLGYVNEVFPDAKIIYPVRDGRNNINSLINAWMHETRFFTYDVPEHLNIENYPHQGWKFVLPSGWRNYVDRPLAEVCAFQWLSCHQSMLNEIAKKKYEGRVLRVRLEDITTNPGHELARIAEFIDLPYDDYFRSVAREMPVVNSQDNDVSTEKWMGKNRGMVEEVLPQITPMMRQLGYEV